MAAIDLQIIQWENVEKTTHTGETGQAIWQTLIWDKLRVRMVEYSPGYLADHWCQLGHIVHCLEGDFQNMLEDGNVSVITNGMTYIVSDNKSSHKSYSKNGCKLLIVDGDFLH